MILMLTKVSLRYLPRVLLFNLSKNPQKEYFVSRFGQVNVAFVSL
jgi:hypothetical protein